MAIDPRPPDQQRAGLHPAAGDLGPLAPAIRARGLRKSYGGRTAVDGVDFEVPSGICFGFLGPNGAGKTTTMKMIYGLAAIDGGSLEVLGQDASRDRRELKRRIGVVPQETNLDAELTVRENLTVHAGYYGIGREEANARLEELLPFTQLADRAGEGISTLSGGMRRRLLIARALVNQPELVVLDEPTTGLDPQARLAVWRSLDRLKARGVTLVLTTHYMEEAARLCDRLVIMDEGRIVSEGEPERLIVETVGREVLELRLEPECDAGELIASLDGALDSYEHSEEALMLYGPSAEALLAAIDTERYPTETAVVRRATLEDVFLKLTGRMLRE